MSAAICNWDGCLGYSNATGFCRNHINVVECAIPGCKTKVGYSRKLLCRLHGNHSKSYRVSEAEYIELKAIRSCEICGEESPKLVFDHDHDCCPTVPTCGECNRGMICTSCNTALGLVKDNIDTLKAMIAYLRA